MFPTAASLPSGIGNNIDPATPEENIVNGNFTLVVSFLINGQELTTPYVKVIGETVPGADIFVNETEVPADKNGNFSLTVGLEEGENHIFISAGDENGDATIERTVYYEKQ